MSLATELSAYVIRGALWACAGACPCAQTTSWGSSRLRRPRPAIYGQGQRARGGYHDRSAPHVRGCGIFAEPLAFAFQGACQSDAVVQRQRMAQYCDHVDLYRRQPADREVFVEGAAHHGVDERALSADLR